MTEHVFVDESKERGYLLAAAFVQPADLRAVSRAIRALVKPGQRRLHFNHERDSRRRTILSSICKLSFKVIIYDAGMLPQRDRRLACLESLVADVVDRGARRLVIEFDESVAEFDRRVVFAATHKTGYEHVLDYVHLRARERGAAPLAVPDAVAWCWARGGVWRDAVRPVVSTVRRL